MMKLNDEKKDPLLKRPIVFYLLAAIILIGLLWFYKNYLAKNVYINNVFISLRVSTLICLVLSSINYLMHILLINKPQRLDYERFLIVSVCPFILVVFFLPVVRFSSTFCWLYLIATLIVIMIKVKDLNGSRLFEEATRVAYVSLLFFSIISIVIFVFGSKQAGIEVSLIKV